MSKCLYCKFMTWSCPISGYYGFPFIKCKKNVWYLPYYETTEEEFLLMALSVENCNHFKAVFDDNG